MVAPIALMAPLPRFDKLDETRRHLILDAAAQEIAEHGFDGASYNRIIERAGVSKGAMYYYFADKDDLFQTVVEGCLAQWLGEIGFPFEADDANAFWAACRTMYERSLRFMLRDPRNAALTFDIARATAAKARHPIVQAHHDRLRAFVQALAEQGRGLGAVRTDLPEDLLVETLLSLLETGDRWLADRWNEDMNDDEVVATATMIVGLVRRIADSPATPR